MTDTKDKNSGAPEQAQKRRRGVVKGVALGFGGVTLTQWSKPVVETVILPAHAQTSGNGVVIRNAASGSGTLGI